MDNWRFANMASAVVNAIRLSVPRGKNSARPKLTQPSDFYPLLKHGPNEAALTDEQRAFIEKRKKHAKRRNRKR